MMTSKRRDREGGFTLFSSGADSGLEGTKGLGAYNIMKDS